MATLTTLKMESPEESRAVAVGFLTTEYSVLQGARASTIAESTGRATMFLGSVSGGLIALGLVASATRVGTAFFAFGLVLLPLLAFVGLVSFDRTLQTAIEDRGYAWRMARVRTCYLEQAPQLIPTLLASPDEQLVVKGVIGARGQEWRSVAGMVAVVTAALAGSTAGLLALVIFDRSLAAGLVAGTLVFAAVALVLMRSQRSAWYAASAVFLEFDAEPEGTGRN
jgi:hypothetical protein